MWAAADEFGPDHDPIRFEEVVDCRAFAEELGIRDDVDVVAAQGIAHDVERADGNRRLVDDDRPRVEQRSDLLGGARHVAEVGRAVVVLRRRHAEEHDVGCSHRGVCTEREAQVPGFAAALDDFVQPGFDEGDFTCLEQSDLALVDVATGHVDAERGQACPGREPDVAGADDGDARGR